MSTNEDFPVLLNVTLTHGDDHCQVKADITGFRANSVRVTPHDDSLIIEMKSSHAPDQSYYMGEVEPTSYRRIVPLGFSVEDQNILTHYQYGKLDISVTKRDNCVSNTGSRQASYA